MKKVKDFILSHSDLFLFLCVAIMVFLRFVFCGFSYAYQADDYIQYHNYAMSESYAELIRTQGLFSSRPLAIILDLFVFSPLWNHMIIAVLLISVLYAASAVLFYKIFRHYFGAGVFFVIFYSLLPLCFEGTYWVSASSRIVCGLFFAATSLYFFVAFAERKRPINAVFFAVFQLLAFSVYEQIFIVSFLATVIFAAMFAVRGSKRAYIAFLSLSNAALYFIFTSVFGGDGLLSKRIDIVSPFTKYFWSTQLEYASRQIGAAFVKGGILTLVKGFVRGIGLIFSEHNYLYLAVAILLCAAFIVLMKKTAKCEGFSKMSPWVTVIVALALAIAPAAIFLFIGNTWFSLRGTVPSMIGASLLFDAILRSILKSKHTAYISASAAFALIFIIAGASETYDYQKSYKADVVCVNALEDVVKTSGNRRIGIINMNSTHLSEQNYFYHEHITGVTESEWALRGALIAAYGEVPPSIVPLDTVKFPFYHGWNESAKRIDGFNSLYFWDDETAALRRLVAVKTSEEGENFVYELYYFDTGTLCATVTHENGYGYIELSENG